MPEPVIHTSGLQRRFGETIAVDSLDLEIEPGAVFGFLGHNGAGKTTTIRLLNGVLTPNAGTMRVLGLDPVTDGPRLRAHTGVLTETPALDDRLTARVTLRLFADIYGVPKEQVNPRVDELLTLFGLQDRADTKIGTYSKGMRQRVALARTIVHFPQVIFLDEPTAGLDPAAAREVHRLVREQSANQQRTVFLCTHNLFEAERLCTHVAVLAHGRVLAMGKPSELATRYGRRQRLSLRVRAEDAELVTQTLTPPPWNAQVQPSTADHGQLTVQGVPQEETPALVQALVSAGVRLFEITPEEATLEDVYFALQDGTERELLSSEVVKW
jgi:ABC-2 type transport system ATP-binding protein